MASLVREAQEEAGLAVDPADVQLVHVVHVVDSPGGQPLMQLVFRARRWKGVPEVREPDKCPTWQGGHRTSFRSSSFPMPGRPLPASPEAACMRRWVGEQRVHVHGEQARARGSEQARPGADAVGGAEMSGRPDGMAVAGILALLYRITLAAGSEGTAICAGDRPCSDSSTITARTTVRPRPRSRPRNRSCSAADALAYTEGGRTVTTTSPGGRTMPALRSNTRRGPCQRLPQSARRSETSGISLNRPGPRSSRTRVTSPIGDHSEEAQWAL